MAESHILHEPMPLYGVLTMPLYQRAACPMSKKYIKSILKLTHIPLEQFIEYLPISIDTYKRKTVFKPTVSERVLQIEEVYRSGLLAFGSDFYDWLNTPSPFFSHQPPKVLLQNSFGTRQLLDQIGRMAHGVLA